MNVVLAPLLAAIQLPGFLLEQDGWVVASSFAAGLVIGGVTLLRQRARYAAREPNRPVVPPFREQLPLFMSEVDRARRYERALAVLVLKLEDPDTVGAALGLVDRRSGHGLVSERARALVQSARQVMFWNVGYVLKDLLRENDVAACDVPAQRYVVLLPEAAEEEALRAATRLGERLFDATGVHVRQGVAVYRQHGLTMEHLVESATAMSDRMASGPLTHETRERNVAVIQPMPKRGEAS
ncbi:hypothetical protein K8I85_15130 [bacterium]|nr:hypothetical protein [bacterium]